jgi:hypothetical protein
MPILRQLLAHTLLLTMIVGGVACICPAEAFGMSPDAPVHAVHRHAADSHGAAAEGDEHSNACDHESCESDCAAVSATSLKAKVTIPSKPIPSPDDLHVLPMATGLPPSTSVPARQSFPATRQVLLPPDSPVRRFDRLLD